MTRMAHQEDAYTEKKNFREKKKSRGKLMNVASVLHVM